MVSGRCYFFDTTRSTLSQAKVICASQFGSTGGKLFEPKSQTIFDQVKSQADSILQDAEIWLGVKKFNTQGTWVYISDGSTLSFHPWRSGTSLTSLDTNSEVYIMFHPHSDYWDVESDQSSDSNQSICEPKN